MTSTPEQMLLRRLRAVPDPTVCADLIRALEEMDERMGGLRNTYWALPQQERQELSRERTALTVAARDILLAQRGT